MADYSKHITEKYECHKCSQRKMYPNESDGKIMGFVCFFCGSVNYPTKDKLKIDKNIKIQKGVDKMSEQCNCMVLSFTEVTILNRTGLFTSMRVQRDTVPKGYYAYDVRHDDDCKGDAVQLARSILVNHWGTLITRDLIKIPRHGYLDIEPEDLKYNTGDCTSMADFMVKFPPKERKGKSNER